MELFASQIDRLSLAAVDELIHSPAFLRQHPDATTFLDATSVYINSHVKTARQAETFLRSWMDRMKILEEAGPGPGPQDVPPQQMDNVDATPIKRQSTATTFANSSPDSKASRPSTQTVPQSPVGGTPTKSPPKVKRIPATYTTKYSGAELAESPCVAVFCVLLWMRRTVVTQLRNLAQKHCDIQRARRYWEWANEHVWRNQLDLFFSSPQAYMTSLLRGGRKGHHDPHHPKGRTGGGMFGGQSFERFCTSRRAGILAKIARLRYVESLVVTVIGKMHNCLQSLTAGLKALTTVATDTGTSALTSASITSLQGKEALETVGSPSMPSMSINDVNEDALDFALEIEALLRRSFPLLDPTTRDGCESVHAPSVNNSMTEPGQHETEVNPRFSNMSFDLSVLSKLPAVRDSGEFSPGAAATSSGGRPSEMAPGRIIALQWFKRLKMIYDRMMVWNKNINHLIYERDAVPEGNRWIWWAKWTGLSCLAMYVSYQNTPEEWEEKVANFRVLARSSFTAYVVEPVHGMVEALTVQRYPSMERKRAVLEEATSLARMIMEYHKDARVAMMEAGVTEEDIARQAVEQEDLTLLRSDYEKAIRSPIRSALFGNLTRLLLIQLQKQKVDMNKVMLGSDEVLEQNDLNFRMAALMPFGMLTTSLAYYFAFVRRKKKDAPIEEAIRECTRSLHRVITNAEREDGDRMDAQSTSVTSLNYLDHGNVLLQVHEIRRLAPRLSYHRTRATFRRHIAEDLEDLEDIESSKAQKLRVLDRMYKTYNFMRPVEM